MADTKISALPSSTTPLAGTEVVPLVQSGTTKKVSVADLTAGRAPSMSGYTVTDGTRQQTSNPSSSDNTIRFTNASTYYWATGLSAPGVAGLNDTYYITHFNGSSWSIFSQIDSTGNLTVNAGNIVPGTAAKGINFTANTPASGMTSQLLNWYEEGAFTPTIAFGGGTTGITYTTQSGLYTRIGRAVTFNLRIVLSNKGSSTGTLRINGLPFSAGTNCYPSYLTDNMALGTGYYPMFTTSGTQILCYLSTNGSNGSITDTHCTNTTILSLSGTYYV